MKTKVNVNNDFVIIENDKLIISVNLKSIEEKIEESEKIVEIPEEHLIKTIDNE